MTLSEQIIRLFLDAPTYCKNDNELILVTAGIVKTLHILGTPEIKRDVLNSKAFTDLIEKVGYILYRGYII